jgi:O-antigen/teichoic acid export membrane protein
MPPSRRVDLSMGFRSPQVRAIAWTGGGDLLGKIALGGLTAIAGRRLGQQDFAIMVGLIASGVLAAAVWDLGVSTLLTREVAAGRIDIAGGIRQSGWLRVQSVWLWAGVYFVSAFILLGAGSSYAVEVTLFGASSLLSAISILPLAAARAHGRYRQASTCIAIGRSVSFLAALPALILPKHALLWMGLALAAGELAVLILATLLARGLSGATTAAPDRRVLTIRRALPLAVNSMLATAYNRYDVVLLPALASLGQLAAYAPASRVQDVLFLIPSAMTVVAIPHLSRVFGMTNSPAEVGRSVKRFIGLGLVVSVPVAALCYLFASTLLAVFLGPHFSDSATSLRILVWFLPFAAVEAPIIAGLIAVNRAGQTTSIFIGTFSTALICHLLLDHRFGAVGASWASLVRDPAGLAIGVLLAHRYGLFNRK